MKTKSGRTKGFLAISIAASLVIYFAMGCKAEDRYGTKEPVSAESAAQVQKKAGAAKTVKAVSLSRCLIPPPLLI